MVLSKSKDDNELDSTIGEGETSKTQPEKNQKSLARWTNSNWKCKKMSSTVVNHRNKGSKGDIEQTTFSQYKNTAPVVNRVQGLRDHSHQERLKKQWPPVHIYHFDHMLKSKYLHGKIQTRTSQIS